LLSVSFFFFYVFSVTIVGPGGSMNPNAHALIVAQGPLPPLCNQ
jgi:hypothetical protein